MSRKLVFIHGRAQQRKNSKALKQEWISSFREGLRKSGLNLPIAEEDIRFPYYGDTLDQLSAGMDPADAARVIIRGPESEAQKEFMRDVLAEVKEKAGISDEEVLAELGPEVLDRGPLNWGWVQGILKVIDRKVPFGSGASVALATKDVFDYLTKPVIHDTINNGVRAAIQAGESTVVVSHSLGTVVAYNVLRKAGPGSGLKVPLFVTVGSPLGVTRIRQSLAPTTFPPNVGSWFNAMDERDVVALYPLERPHFHVNPAIINKTDVNNHTENRHGIAGYLEDAEVAKRIHDALVAD
jgi:hypothetical protein